MSNQNVRPLTGQVAFDAAAVYAPYIPLMWSNASRNMSDCYKIRISEIPETQDKYLGFAYGLNMMVESCEPPAPGSHASMSNDMGIHIESKELVEAITTYCLEQVKEDPLWARLPHLIFPFVVEYWPERRIGEIRCWFYTKELAMIFRLGFKYKDML